MHKLTCCHEGDILHFPLVAATLTRLDRNRQETPLDAAYDTEPDNQKG